MERARARDQAGPNLELLLGHVVVEVANADAELLHVEVAAEVASLAALL